MHRLLLWPLLIVLALPAWANARMTVLMDVLAVDESMRILHAEGMEYAKALNDDMLEGKGGEAWRIQVEALYNTELMKSTLRMSLEKHLQGDLLEDTITFYSSELGQRIVHLENSARAAISNSDVEDMARERHAEAKKDSDPRLDVLEKMVEADDLVVANVKNTLRANYQFLRGLADGDAYDLSEEYILADVASQREEITTDTSEWLYAYMLMAYHPLSDTEMESYLEFIRSDAGRALNNALFDGFGVAYEDISYGLGRAVALNMTAQDL